MTTSDSLVSWWAFRMALAWIGVRANRHRSGKHAVVLGQSWPNEFDHATRTK